MNNVFKMYTTTEQGDNNTLIYISNNDMAIDRVIGCLLADNLTIGFDLVESGKTLMFECTYNEGNDDSIVYKVQATIHNMTEQLINEINKF